MKVALVTGGGGGIGAACARALAADGYAVVLVGRTLATLEAARTSIAGPGACVVADTLIEADLARAVAAATELGELRAAVSVVGGALLARLSDTSQESFSAVLRMNIVSAFNVLRVSVPAMAAAGGGSIVCISSVAATVAYPKMASYSAAKAAVEGLVRGAALELAPLGLRVNSVRPGLIRSGGSQRQHAELGETVHTTPNDLPLVRPGEPHEVGAAVAYLCSDAASWVTGQSLAVDGGRSLVAAPRYLFDAL